MIGDFKENLCNSEVICTFKHIDIGDKVLYIKIIGQF